MPACKVSPGKGLGKAPSRIWQLYRGDQLPPQGNLPVSRLRRSIYETLLKRERKKFSPRKFEPLGNDPHPPAWCMQSSCLSPNGKDLKAGFHNDLTHGSLCVNTYRLYAGCHASDGCVPGSSATPPGKKGSIPVADLHPDKPRRKSTPCRPTPRSLYVVRSFTFQGVRAIPLTHEEIVSGHPFFPFFFVAQPLSLRSMLPVRDGKTSLTEGMVPLYVVVQTTARSTYGISYRRAPRTHEKKKPPDPTSNSTFSFDPGY